MIFSRAKKIFYLTHATNGHQKNYGRRSFFNEETARQDFINSHPIAFSNSCIARCTMVKNYDDVLLRLWR